MTEVTTDTTDTPPTIPGEYRATAPAAEVAARATNYTRVDS